MDGPIPTNKSDKSYRVTDEGMVEKTELKFSSSLEGIYRFVQRFQFFTPAALYLYGQFRDSVLIDFLEQHGAVDLYHVRFHRPLFRGLKSRSGDESWNHVLWAIERPHWQSLVDHIVAATLTDFQQRLLLTPALQRFEIVDPLYMDRARLLDVRIPTVEIGAFAVRTNAFEAAFDYSGDVLMDPPKLLFFPASEDSRIYARALFKGQDPQLAVHLRNAILAQLEERRRGSSPGPSSGNQGRSGAG